MKEEGEGEEKEEREKWRKGESRGRIVIREWREKMRRQFSREGGKEWEKI